MKHSPISCALAMALAAVVLTPDGALAASSFNSSKSNVFKINPNDPNATKTCTNGGGVVSTDKNGQKICTQPAGTK